MKETTSVKAIKENILKKLLQIFFTIFIPLITIVVYFLFAFAVLFIILPMSLLHNKNPAKIIKEAYIEFMSSFTPSKIKDSIKYIWKNKL